MIIANDNISYETVYREGMIEYMGQCIVVLIETVESNTILGRLDCWNVIHFKPTTKKDN